MQNLLTKTIDIKNGNPDKKRQEILNYFRKTWDLDEKLYTQLISDEIFYHRGDPLRHILLFYLGHTAVFFINKLFLAKLIESRIQPEIESIFAIGVDEMSWDDLNEKNYNWPAVQELRKYRDKAKQIIESIILSVPLNLPIKWEDPFWLILMGIEHERIHLETSSVLIRQLPLNEVVPDRFGEICTEMGVAPQNRLISVSGGKIHLGKSRNNETYGWDLEYGNYTELIENFKASEYLISNQEFLEFINDGGYKNKNFWTEEGWKWRKFKNAEMPLFWIKNEGTFKLRLVAQEIDMPWNWPAEVNYLEAKAYCNWKTEKDGITYRLPSEAEWKRLVEISKISDELAWKIAPGNINLEHYASPCPVNKFKTGDFYDLIGNVWQWTETPVTGYPGFKVHPLYDDFATPTFDGKHNLIKGGSWISTGNEAIQDARYAFRRHFYQHAGFRIVQSENPLTIHNDEYETDVEIANSCESNWGDLVAASQNYQKKMAEIAIDAMKGRKNIKVLDLNADTGRLAFELAQHFENITAIDFSARFIRQAIQLQEKGFIRYIIKDEGELVFYRDIVLSDFKLSDKKDNIEFLQADANNLKPIFTGYDLIIVPNLIEELICPILFLKDIHKRLNSNGILIVSSTYDWEKHLVKREHWPGGFKKDGEPVSSFDGISSILGANFDIVEQPQNLTLNIRKSSRISEIQVSEISIWKKLN